MGVFIRFFLFTSDYVYSVFWNQYMYYSIAWYLSQIPLLYVFRLQVLLFWCMMFLWGLRPLVFLRADAAVRKPPSYVIPVFSYKLIWWIFLNKTLNPSSMNQLILAITYQTTILRWRHLHSHFVGCGASRISQITHLSTHLERKSIVRVFLRQTGENYLKFSGKFLIRCIRMKRLGNSLKRLCWKILVASSKFQLHTKLVVCYIVRDFLVVYCLGVFNKKPFIIWCLCPFLLMRNYWWSSI